MSDRIAELEAEVETLAQALVEAQAENARLERRVDELLRANNVEVERRREAKREVEQLQAKLHCMCGSPIDHSAWEGHTPVSMYDYALDRAEEENAALRRALDAANIVRGSDPTLPDVAVEREEIEGA